MTPTKTPEAGPRTRGGSRHTAAVSTRALLTCGAVAGPVFVTLVAIQLLVRDGFDLRRHPISLLSLGDLGWVQITNFVVTGLLCLAFAVGLRRVLHPGRAGTWGPILVGAYGVGMVMGGVFVADPGLGFPEGAPAGTPEEMSWHAMVHAVAPALAFNAVIVACLVFLRRFVSLGERRWAAFTAVTTAFALVLTMWPDMDSVSWRMAVAMVVISAWMTLLAARLRAGVTASPAPVPAGSGAGAAQVSAG